MIFARPTTEERENRTSCGTKFTLYTMHTFLLHIYLLQNYFNCRNILSKLNVCNFHHDGGLSISSDRVIRQAEGFYWVGENREKSVLFITITSKSNGSFQDYRKPIDFTKTNKQNLRLEQILPIYSFSGT